MTTSEKDIQNVHDRIPAKWYATVAMTVMFSGAVGVWAKSIVWRGNAFTHELSYANNALSDETEVLFIGSSHTFQGVDPRLIDAKSVNLGYGEANLGICRLLLDQHLNQLPSLKIVVVQCEDWSFELDSVARQQYNYRTLLDQGISIVDVPLPFGEKAKAIGRTIAGVDYPSVTPRQWMDRRLKRLQWEGVPGFRPPSIKHKQTNTQKSDGNAGVIEPPNVSFEEQFNALVEIIGTCKSRELQIKLIRYPHTKSFESRVETGSWKKAITLLIDENLIYRDDVWDFYDDSIVDFDDELDFADSNHLHPDAIPKFCDALNRMVQRALSDNR